MRVLLVEDEPAAARMLAKGLREQAYAVDVAVDGDDASFRLATTDYDAVILDVMLPRKDGLAVARETRAAGSAVPILMLTARDAVLARIAGLDSGADDYLTKPFDFDELLARLRALIRRGIRPPLPEHLKVGPLELDTRSRQVSKRGRVLPLTTREYALLEFLARRTDQVVGRAEIAEHVWDESYDPLSNVIDVYIQRLRRKIDDAPGDSLIRTRRGEGYSLVADGVVRLLTSTRPQGEITRSLRSGLSIRARLTLWYGLMVLLALVAAGVFVVWLHARLGMARVDEELHAASVTVAGVLRNELGEGLDLPDSVRDMMAELSLAGEGFAVVSADDGAIVDNRVAGTPVLPDAVILSAGATPATVRASPADIRIRAVALDAVGHRVRVVTWKSLAPLQAERGTLERAILLGIPMAVLLAIAGGLSIGRRALRPLTEMAAQAGAIGSHNLDARLAVTSPVDELGTLGHAFNQLLERLAAALQQQRVFMADASHQLRTPVSVIRTAAQVMLSREHRSEEEYRESLDVVARQAQRLTKSVEDMFILALADAQARPLHTAPLYFDELVGEVIDDLRVVAESRQVTLRGDFAGEAPLIGDEDLLRQMLANLLDNAIRHTPAGGTVTVSLTRSAAMLTVTVTDTGRGIAVDDTDRIFERFVRVGPPGSEPGGGLGLPIARWIAEAHGGTLRLASTGADGSQFVVTLPAPRT